MKSTKFTFASHTHAVRSLDAIYKTPLPTLPHFTTLTEAVCPPRVYSTLLVIVDQKRTVPSLDNEANRGAVALRCMGSQESKVTHFVCPFSASPIGFPVFGSHRRTWPSCPPVASFLSIASHSTQRTKPLWPESMCDGVSVFESHSRAFVSLEPMARKFLVNENEVQRMGKVCPPRDDEVRRVILTRPACISTAMDAHLVPIYMILSSSSTKSRKRMHISSEVTTLSLILLWD